MKEVDKPITDYILHVATSTRRGLDIEYFASILGEPLSWKPSHGVICYRDTNF